MKSTNKNKLILLFSIVYMVSYITRINYGAVVSEMVSATLFSKQQLSTALTGSFITYGIGQIFSGILGDRFSPKKLVLMGLSVTVTMNLLLPFCNAVWLMTLVWSINGFAQAFMWPPIVKIMVALLTQEEYSKGVVKVSWGSSIGTIIVYLLAPVVILSASWKSVFWLSAFCGIIMMLLWQKYCPSISVKNTTIQKNDKNETGKKEKIFTPVFFILAIAITLCGMLRDGVSTWTPSLLSESFNLSNASGILSGAVLPVFGMICYELTMLLHIKKLRNPVTCAGIVFLAGALSSIVLRFALNSSPILSVISVALLNSTMHGVNLMIVCMLPAFYARIGKVSTISGIFNSFIYMGSAISTYGIAVLTENFGWNVTVSVWIIIAVLGSAICLAVAKHWNKNMNN